MASDAISPRTLVKELRGLNNEKLKYLFYILELPLDILENIEHQQKCESCIIDYVEAWFSYDVEASWQKVVAGLKEMGENVLATRLSLNYCPDNVPTSPNCNASPSSDSPMEPPVSPSYPLFPSSFDECQTRSEINILSDTFSDLMSEMREEMCEKEGRNPKFLGKLRDHLLSLPIAKKGPHIKFFAENEDEIIDARNTYKLFAILFRYCSYNNYEIMQGVARRFCNPPLKKKMHHYTRSIENFEKATNVDDYLDAISASDAIASEFTKMAFTIEKPASVCTLYEIRQLTQDIAERASLHRYSMYIGEITPHESGKSFEVVIGFFAGAFMGSVLTGNFYVPASHLLSYVGVQQFSIQFSPQETLVCLFSPKAM